MTKSPRPSRRRLDLTSPTLGWISAVVVGAVMLTLNAFSLVAQPYGILAFLLGTVATIVGGAGLGATWRSGSLDPATRDRLRPPFRSTFRAYEGLSKLQFYVRESRQSLKPDGTTDDVGWAAVLNRLDVLDSRLDEQLSNSDDAYLEWHDVLPDEAEALWQELKARRSAQ